MKNLLGTVVSVLMAGALASPVGAQPAQPIANPAPPAQESPAVTPPAAPEAKPAARRTNGSATPRASASEQLPAAAWRPEPGVARQNNVNVRGQASINSEALTRLSKGQPVTLLEEVSIKSPKQDEPARWYRITLPTNVAVWVHSMFIDSANNSVKPNRLNVRGGPSENHSIVARLEKGAIVQPLGTRGDWIRIEPPTNAFGFVAAHLVEKAPAIAPPVEIAAARPTPPPATAVTPEPAPAEPPPAVTTIPENPGVVPGANVATAPVPAPVVPAPAETIAPAVPAPAPIPAPAEPDPEMPIETVRKVVSREGVLRGSVSIQAPTYFALRSIDTGKTINYVFSPSTNLLLKEFKGQRIIVTGEEVLDERWQNTPVLVVDTLQTVP